MWLSNKLSAGVLDLSKSPQAWNISLPEVPSPVHGNLGELSLVPGAPSYLFFSESCE